MTRTEAEEIWMANQVGMFRGSQSELAHAALLLACIECPNCGSTMNAGDPCPECEHVDGDIECRCNSCSCAICGGTGKVEDHSGNFPERPGVTAGPFINYMECPACAGTGSSQ